MKTKISCNELLSYIPDNLLKNLEEETNVNVQTKKLTGEIMFKLLLFSLLNSDRLSLRVIEEFFNSEQFSSFADKGKTKVKHSGIGDRLGKIDFEFFQKIFEHLSEKFKTIFNRREIRKKYKITKFDSTLLSCSANLLKIGIVGGPAGSKTNKRYIKHTVGCNHTLPEVVETFSEQSEMSEEIALKKVILSSQYDKESIVVFDRGLQRRKTFCKFKQKNISFVTRLKTRICYKEVEKFKEIQGRKTKTLKLKKDLIIKLKEENSRHFTKENFRLIKAISLATGEEFIFLTNITNLNAREITDIYKERWSIEVFFRFIKQELNFKNFVSISLNGIKVMLYMTLIASLLLTVYKIKNKISSYKIAKIRFKLELESEILKIMVLRYNLDIIQLQKLIKPLPN